ncbi:MAG: ATP-binding protein [Bacteroidota bacterium]
MKHLLFVLLVCGCFGVNAQMVNAVEAGNIAAYEKSIKRLQEQPDETLFEKVVNNLSFDCFHSAIPLKNLREYIPQLYRILDQRPELEKHRYLLDFTSAVEAYSSGSDSNFIQRVSVSKTALLNQKRYRDAFRLNVEAAHYLAHMDKKDEAKALFYDNEYIIDKFSKDILIQSEVVEAIQNANSLGYLFFSRNQFDSAEKYYRIGRQRAISFKLDPWIGITSGNLGSVYQKTGKHDEAIELLLIDKSKSTQAGIYTSAINALFELVSIHLQRNQYDKVKIYLEEADSLSKLVDKKEHIEFLNQFKIKYATRLAQIHAGVGDLSVAKQYYEEVIERLTASEKNHILEKQASQRLRYRIEDNMIKLAELEVRERNFWYIIILVGLLLLSFLVLAIIQVRYNNRLKEKGQKIQQQAEKLERLNVEKNKLFSVVAHDIKSPLSNLQDVLELYQGQIIDEAMFLKYKDDINYSLAGLSGTLENLLNWASVGIKEGIRVNLTKVYPDDVVQDLIKQTQAQIQSKELYIRYHNHYQGSVMADYNLLLVVLRNFLNNAIKFSPKGKPIEITIEETAGGENNVTISIKDYGMGMPQNKVQHLLHNTDNIESTYGTAGERGSGLGLIIVKDFIRLMNGELHIQSETGHGSTFSVTVPKYQS